jgi:hypothetical protein
MQTNQQLQLAALQALKYGTYVYPQIANDYAVNNGEFIINYPHDTLPYDSLLFMVPCKFSIATENVLTRNYLILRKAAVVNGIRTYVEFKRMLIVVERNDGTTVPATKGDILANRLCIFRFISNDIDTAILINSPYYNSMSLTNLTVLGSTVFREIPCYQDTDLSTPVPLATATEVQVLREKIEALESKIQYGEEDPDVALEGLPEGTIYIQVESLEE